MRGGRGCSGGESRDSGSADELIYNGCLRVIFLLLYQIVAMSKSLLLVLLLAVGTLSYHQNFGNNDYNYPGYKTSVSIKIKNCLEPQCYSCGLNQQFNRNTLYCDCNPGYLPINGFCGKCSEGYEYDPVLMQCTGINPCGYNQHLVSGSCKCLPGLIVIQNICQRCPTNQTYFPQYDACRCTTGYSLVNGACIFVVCITNEVYDQDTQACVCAQGYFRVVTRTSTTDVVTKIVTIVNVRECIQCAMNKVYNAATKTCDPFTPPNCSFNEYFFQNTCFCEISYVRIGGLCITCPKNSFYDWITDSCVCLPGFYFVGEVVKRIPYQQYDTGSSFTTNPSRSYSYKAPYGLPRQEPTIIKGSNYDASGINTYGPNYNNISPVPPNYGR